MLHGHWRSCTIVPHHMVFPWLATLRPIVASSPFSNFRQLLATKSVETWVSSPAPVHHQAVCASVRNQTTGAACAPQPLALLSRPHGAPPQGPPLARSVAPGRCIFVVACCACLRRRTIAPVCANVRIRRGDPPVLHGHSRPPPQGPPRNVMAFAPHWQPARVLVDSGSEHPPLISQDLADRMGMTGVRAGGATQADGACMPFFDIGC